LECAYRSPLRFAYTLPGWKAAPLPRAARRLAWYRAKHHPPRGRASSAATATHDLELRRLLRDRAGYKQGKIPTTPTAVNPIVSVIEPYVSCSSNPDFPSELNMLRLLHEARIFH